MDGEADISAVAAAIGHPARGRMLMAMLGGRALPATDLAKAARVSRSTASAHLAQLTGAGLVEVRRQGRHRYHRLAGQEVAEAIERLAAISPPIEIRSLSDGNRNTAQRAARSCYDHLAGLAGVGLFDRLCELGGLDRETVTVGDPAPFAALGVDLSALGRGRRPLTRTCIDWTERRTHLAGELGAAVLTSLLDQAWVVRRPKGRAVAVTPRGRAGLRDAIGLDVAALAPDALDRTPLRRVA
jgi:DNA-binding transcriptional ArsR family regulator